MSTDIALSRKTKVFAVIETVPGTISFPTAADFIMPAGDALINQTPAFTDSKEMADSLDLIEIVMEIEEVWGWELSPEKSEEMEHWSVRDLVLFIEQKLARQGR